VVPLLTAAAYVVLWILDALTVEAALIAAMAALALASGAAVAAVLSRHRIGRPDRGLARSTLSYGLRAHAGDVAGTVNHTADVLIVAAVLGSSSAGIYAVATNVSGSIVALLSALSIVLVPAAARRGSEAIAQTMRLVWTIAVPLAAVLAALAGVLILLVYGESFEDSVPPLRILLPGVVLLTASGVLAAGIRGSGRPLAAALPEAAGLVLTVAGLALFLESGGVKAAALVSTVTYAAAFLMMLAIHRRVTGSLGSAFGLSR
jgi:O-antigen/teichoic acid export membrane protein